jgi:hypothetical protein
MVADKSSTSLPRYAMFPFFMGYAAALLEREAFEVEAIDAVPLNLSLDDFFRRAVASKPDAILLEPATTSFDWTLEVASNLKNDTGATIILAGSHASVLAAKTLKEFSFVDFVLIGEYEYSLLNLIRALSNNGNSFDLNGIAFRTRDNEIIVHENLTSIDPNSPNASSALVSASDLKGMQYYHDGFCQNRPAVQVHFREVAHLPATSARDADHLQNPKIQNGLCLQSR